MTYLLALEDAAALRSETVGSKFSALARARQGGLPVPRAIVVNTAAHRHYVRSHEPPAGLPAELERAAVVLDLAAGVAVRSSGTQEDLSNRSFAGQYETFLDIKTEDELLTRIEDCWKSSGGARAKAYSGAPADGEIVTEMAVIVQQMVHAAASGVAFTANPLRPTADEIVIEGVAGLGDEMVSGHVTPQRVVVRRGEVTVESTPEGAPRPGLDSRQWLQIAELAAAAEREFGTPQDIEWAIDQRGDLWLLQARPITALATDSDSDVPTGAWTRGVAVDLWADRLSPFMADQMTRKAHRWDFSAISKLAGVPVVQPALAVVDGFLYVNCASLGKVLTVLPKSLRVPDLLDLFPPGFDSARVPAPSLSRMAVFLLRSFLVGLRFPASNPLFCNRLSRRGVKRLEDRLRRVAELPADSPTQALAKVREASESLTLLQERNQWPYLYATVLTLALRFLAVDRLKLSHGRFLGLISGRLSNVTGATEREFREIAGRMERDDELVSLFRQREELTLEMLPLEARSDVEIFLDEFGARARHRGLDHERWIENPSEVLGMIRTLVLNESGRESAVTRDGGLSAEEMPPERLSLRLLRRPVRAYLDLREDLRFFLDRTLLVLRRSLLALGKQIGLGSDVFFLTEAELEEIVHGGEDASTAATVAAERRARAAVEAEAPPFYVDGLAVEAIPNTGDTLHGIGTSLGRVTGRARVVENPAEAGLDRGDVLVARNTDPGWTPILSVVGAIVVEEGGLLNHCSIVARELGIPAVVGVRRATQVIPDGSEVTVDGSLGIVHMDSREPGKN